jgi:hypothetical protein
MTDLEMFIDSCRQVINTTSNYGTNTKENILKNVRNRMPNSFSRKEANRLFESFTGKYWTQHENQYTNLVNLAHQHDLKEEL